MHRPQWNINRPLTADLLRICQALQDCGVRVYSTPTMTSAWVSLYNTGGAQLACSSYHSLKISDLLNKLLCLKHHTYNPDITCDLQLYLMLFDFNVHSVRLLQRFNMMRSFHNKSICECREFNVEFNTEIRDCHQFAAFRSHIDTNHT